MFAAFIEGSDANQSRPGRSCSARDFVLSDRVSPYRAECRRRGDLQQEAGASRH
jgi:hypothetical protein